MGENAEEPSRLLILAHIATSEVRSFSIFRKAYELYIGLDSISLRPLGPERSEVK